MNFVISANWRNPESPNKWLVRRADQKPEEAVEHSTVHAKGVVFCPATDWERGFGCSIVAFANEVLSEGTTPEDSITLRFIRAGSVSSRFEDESGKSYPNLAELHLELNGEIKGVPNP